MKLINLIASPGSGKSTGAAYLFAKMKLDGFSAELVTEYAKSKIFEGSGHVLQNQIYLMAKQYKMLKDLQNYGLKNVVTDSPLILGVYYGRDLPYFNEYRELLLKLRAEFDNYDVFIKRVKPYVEMGRNQNEQESDEISEFLSHCVGSHCTIMGDQEGYDSLYRTLKNHILVKS